MSLPRLTMRPLPRSRPTLAGRANETLRLSVGANSSAPRVAASAGPIVSSSMAARNPPWMWPAGFVNSALPSNSTSMVPASGETSRIEMPSVAAALGGGSLPSWICQKNADLSMQMLTMSVFTSPLLAWVACVTDER